MTKENKTERAPPKSWPKKKKNKEADLCQAKKYYVNGDKNKRVLGKIEVDKLVLWKFLLRKFSLPYIKAISSRKYKLHSRARLWSDFCANKTG